MKTQKLIGVKRGLQFALFGALIVGPYMVIHAQGTGPALVDPNLAVRAVNTSLNLPTGMAFLGSNDMLVLEKASGKVQRILNGEIVSTVLDLPVNSGSERGLLGIALHPDFPINPGVYLYWTETISNADSADLADTPL